MAGIVGSTDVGPVADREIVEVGSDGATNVSTMGTGVITIIVQPFSLVIVSSKSSNESLFCSGSTSTASGSVKDAFRLMNDTYLPAKCNIFLQNGLYLDF